ncbi:MAG: hypothetical protein IPJ76_12880 [Flavobacteriales bacterium]|nr:MAG: hypothetical protein IPJ76_12880 [Flavobacteriales bacterium]
MLRHSTVGGGTTCPTVLMAEFMVSTTNNAPLLHLPARNAASLFLPNVLFIGFMFIRVLELGARWTGGALPGYR